MPLRRSVRRVVAGLTATIVVASPVCGGRAHAETFDCLVTPSMTLKIGSPVATTLATVTAERGQIVTKGQELARLESSVETASLALRRAKADNAAEILAQRAKVEAAQVELSRAGRQIEGVSVTSQKVAELRTTLRVAEQDLALAILGRQLAQLELEQALALLAQRVIRSPIDGIVTERALGPGEYVRADNHIVAVAAIDPLYVEVYPPTRLQRLVKPGDVAQIEMFAGRPTLPAVVTVVDRIFDAGSDTGGVRLTLPNPNLTLPAGLRCKATFADQPDARE